MRFWDHDLGPDEPRLLAGRVPAEPTAGTDDPSGLGRIALHDLTPVPGRSLDEAQLDVSPDGSTVATTWSTPEQGGRRVTLVPIDTRTGERRVLLDDADEEYGAPAFSPDGRRLAVAGRAPLHAGVRAPRAPGRPRPGDGERTDLAPGWDRWPRAPGWTPDGSALVFPADDQGRSPVFRLDLAADAQPVRLTGDHGAYTDVQVSPGRALGLRAALRRRRPAGAGAARRHAPRAAAAVAAGPGAGRRPAGQRSPRSTRPPDDGTPLRAWLVLPAGASAHATRRRCCCGSTAARCTRGTRGRWRWNPWLMAARGYAVLLPDPALSTGYGQEFVQRGWGRWGGGPVHRPDDDHRRRRRPAGHRRRPDGRDGRLVRRLHGQLDRRPHRPVPGHRHARQPLGAGPVRAHDRRLRLLAPRDDRAR